MLRGLFPNPSQLLSPGMFVRIRVPIGPTHPAILATERAIGSDQGQKFLYVLDEHDKVVYREVQIGAIQNGLRVIESGLTPGERFIINGLQRVKPGDTVQPKLVEASSPGEAEGKAEAMVTQNGDRPATVVRDASFSPGEVRGNGNPFGGVRPRPEAPPAPNDSGPRKDAGRGEARLR